MWNLMDLTCPSSDIMEYQPQEKCLVEELRDIVTIFTTAANILTSENPLWGEMYVLRNLQVKYKRILRCDKCLVYLHRVSHCVKKMVLLNLSKSYLDLAERFLTGFSSQDPTNTVWLPSRQQIEYILIRTVSAAKLICDGIKYSRETFCNLLQKIKVGHMILDLVIAASVTAKLIVLLKAILEQICSMYQQVLAWRFKLKKGSYKWAEKLDLPDDLKNWLQMSASEVLKPVPMSHDDIKMVSSLLKGSKQKDSDTDSITIVDEVNSYDNGVSRQSQNGNDTDYGEVIPRKKRKKNDSLSTDQKALLLKINQVQNLEDLEDVWSDINSFSGNHLPKELSSKKKKILSNLFLRIRKSLLKKSIIKKLKQPVFLKKALPVFSKHLGFTQSQIEMCQNEYVVSNGVHSAEMNFEPVKTLKELKILFKHLCTILQISNEFEKLRKLQKIFKCRRTDIRLLRQNGEKNTAKQLIFCTSKVILTLCQK